MCLNKTILLFLLLTFLPTAQAYSFLGLGGRAEQKATIAAVREASSKGDYDTVIELSEEFFTRNINAPKRRLKRIYLLLGNAYKNRGDYDKALLTYSEAREFYPKDIDLNLALADIYVVGELTDKAVEVYKNILKLDKDNNPAKLGLARAYLSEGLSIRASDLFEEYINNKGETNGLVYYDYALSKFMANDYNKALSLAQEAASFGETADIIFLIAKIYKAQGEEKKAFDTIKLASQMDKTRNDILLLRGLWLAYDEDYQAEALEIANNYLKDKPQSQLANFIKFLANKRAGDNTEASKNLKAITSSEGNGFTKQVALKLTENKKNKKNKNN
ncbi:MAG: tetratricopeptide repeat protein [Elusimicrobiota bacterium]|jgi:tetratricopeptide (TPR) repeat protein|nr:tetratricopeptide repeat protein [Elusimicrobiota bacterium]